MTSRIITADALDGLRQIESKSVDCCVTSPPYFGLRDYGHDKQIGLEETPELYIERLVDVFREVRRVLADDGTLWVVIGDSYAGSGKGGAKYPENAGRYKQGTNRGMVGITAVTKVGWGECKCKDLIGIPWMLAFALRADAWYLRSDIIWNKKNPMPESVRDRPTRTHEYIFLLSKSKQYYFDSEAIKEPAIWKDDRRAGQGRLHYRNGKRTGGEGEGQENFVSIKDTRNKRSVWTVATRPYKEAHFATYPPDLIRPCILAGSRKGGTVLDPFLGSGTTAVVAIEEERNYIGIEINAQYVAISEKRIAGLYPQMKLSV